MKPFHYTEKDTETIIKEIIELLLSDHNIEGFTLTGFLQDGKAEKYDESYAQFEKVSSCPECANENLSIERRAHASANLWYTTLDNNVEKLEKFLSKELERLDHDGTFDIHSWDYLQQQSEYETAMSCS